MAHRLDDMAIRTRGEILDSLQRIVTMDSSDQLCELDAVPREPLMDEVGKIRDLAFQLYVEAYAAGYDMRNMEVLGALA